MPDMNFTVGEQRFVYDAEKGRINKQKHGISFETAAYVFLDSLRLDFRDDRHSTSTRLAGSPSGWSRMF